MSVNPIPKGRPTISPRPTPNPNAGTRAVRPSSPAMRAGRAPSEFRMLRTTPHPTAPLAPAPQPAGVPQPTIAPKPAGLPWIQRFAPLGRFLGYAGTAWTVFSVAQGVFVAADEIDRQMAWLPGPLVDPAIWDDPHAATKEAQRRFGAMPIGDLQQLQRVRERQNHLGAPPMVVTTADGSNVTIPLPGRLNGYARQLDRDTNGDGSIVARAQDELALIEIDLRRRSWEAVIHSNDNATTDLQLQDLEIEIARLMMNGKITEALQKQEELDALKRTPDSAVSSHLQIKASAEDAAAPSPQAVASVGKILARLSMAELDNFGGKSAAHDLIVFLKETPGDASTAVLLALSQRDIPVSMKTAIGRILEERGVAVTDIETLLLLAPAQLAREAAVPALLEICLRRKGPSLGQSAVDVLKTIPGPAASKALANVLNQGHHSIVNSAFQALLDRKSEDAVPELLEIVRQRHNGISLAVRILSATPGEAATQALIQCLDVGQLGSVKSDIIRELARRRSADAIPELVRLVAAAPRPSSHGGPWIPSKIPLDAVTALAAIPGRAATLALVRVLQVSEDNDVLKIAAGELGSRGAEVAIPKLEEFAAGQLPGRPVGDQLILMQSASELIAAAAGALSAIPGDASTAAMFRLLEDRRAPVEAQGIILLALHQRHAFTEDRILLLVDCATRSGGRYHQSNMLAANAVQVLAQIPGDAVTGMLKAIFWCLAPHELTRDIVGDVLTGRGEPVEKSNIVQRADALNEIPIRLLVDLILAWRRYDHWEDERWMSVISLLVSRSGRRVIEAFQQIADDARVNGRVDVVAAARALERVLLSDGVDAPALDNAEPASIHIAAKILSALGEPHTMTPPMVSLLIMLANYNPVPPSAVVAAAALFMASQAISVLSGIPGEEVTGALMRIAQRRDIARQLKEAAQGALVGRKKEEDPVARMSPDQVAPTLDGQEATWRQGRPVADVSAAAPAPVQTQPQAQAAPPPKAPPVTQAEVDEAFAAIDVPPEEIHGFVRLVSGTSATVLPVLMRLATDEGYRTKVVTALTCLQDWHREQHDPDVPDVARALKRVWEAAKKSSPLELD